jgi:hypothetical protein
MIREIVASSLGVLAGLGCVLVVLLRYGKRPVPKRAITPPQALHSLGFFYAAFAIFFVPAVLVAWAISKEGAAAAVIAGVCVPALLIFQGLDSLLYESRKYTGFRCWGHRIIGLFCLLIVIYMFVVYSRYILANWW